MAEMILDFNKGQSHCFHHCIFIASLAPPSTIEIRRENRNNQGDVRLLDLLKRRVDDKLTRNAAIRTPATGGPIGMSLTATDAAHNERTSVSEATSNEKTVAIT